MAKDIEDLLYKNPEIAIQNLIKDSELIKLNILENKEPLVKISTSKMLVVNLYPEVKNSLRLPNGVAIIRKAVGEKLIKVAKNLPKDYKLVIIDAYRPLNVQIKQFSRCYNKMLRKYKNSSIAIEKASIFVAPPEIAPHCTGGAVDVCLSFKGKLLDFGTLYAEKNDYSFSGCLTIPKKAKNNREILFKAMLKENFVNYPSEWWHWSYVDIYWGAVKKTFPIYGKVSLKNDD